MPPTISMTQPDQRWAAVVADALPDPVAIIDAQARLVWANPAAERRFGWRLAEVVGTNLVHLVHPDDVDTALLSLTSVQDKVEGTVVELRLLDRADRYGRFEVRGAGLPIDGGRGALLSLREATDRRRWEIAGGDPQVLGGILDASASLTVLVGPDGVVRGANRYLTRVLGRALDLTVGAPLATIVDPGDRSLVETEVRWCRGSRSTRSFEARLATVDGRAIPFALTLVDLVDDGAVGGLVLSGTDIAALVDARERLRHLALHDDLTGLPNRAALRAHLEDLLRDGPGGGTLIFGDLDGLKQVNDGHGHPSGDRVLTTTAERLCRVVRSGDLVARISGDEFAIVVATDDPRAVPELEARIAAVMAEPVDLPDGTSVTVSIATGGAPLATSDVDGVLAAADRAMYAAKRARQT